MQGKREINVATNPKSLADLVRSRLNQNADKEIAKLFSADESLLQIDSWIELKPFFRQTSGGGLGFPCGHLTQIVGKPDSGKSTLMMEGMVGAQKAGGVAYLIDSEHKFDMKRFQLMGGDPTQIVVIQVDSLEEAWDAIQKILNEVKALRGEGIDAPMMLAWDSIAASTPQKLIESEAGDSHMAVEAKLNNKNIRRLRHLIRETNLAFVGVNHFYMTVPKSPYERSELVIKGGEELAFLSTLILLTKQGAKITRNIKGEEQQIGRVTRFTVHKGHFSGRSIVSDVYVVDKGILETKEELEEYKRSLRGEY
jgi:RecA/RadA recombinase